MIQIFNDKIVLKLTLTQKISDELLREVQGILPNNEKLPEFEFNRDGNYFRYLFKIKTRNSEVFNRNFGSYKINNPQLDIVTELTNTSVLNRIINFLNLKNLIFPTGVTLRYTIENFDPKQFKEMLESNFPDEEFPDSIHIGDTRFNRFKIKFNIQNMESFKENISNFKEDNPTIDINEEYDKRTLKSYINFLVYVIVIIFTITRFMGIDIITWVQKILK